MGLPVVNFVTAPKRPLGVVERDRGHLTGAPKSGIFGAVPIHDLPY